MDFFREDCQPGLHFPDRHPGLPDHFRGRVFLALVPTQSDWRPGHIVRIAYTEKQLEESMYSQFEKIFRNNGFSCSVPGADLLRTILLGGNLSLKGPKFINRQTYTMEAMKSQFMRCERNLVNDLMATVFNTEENLPYSEELLTPLIVVSSHFEFDASVALRKSTVLFHASPAADEHRDALYRVIVEGKGKGSDQYTHMFQFQPSTCWLTTRYPEEVD